MKKLFALLVACTTMVCAFGSCGDKKENSETESQSVAENDESGNISEESTEQISEESDTQSETNEYIADDAEKTAFFGKWECNKLVANGQELTDLQGIPAYAVFQYDFLENGNIKLPDSLTSASNAENPVTYQWEIIGENQVEVKGSNGSSVIYNLDGEQLTNVDGNTEIYLKRVDEFTEFDFKAYYEEMMSQQNNGGYVLTPVETGANGEVVSRGEPITIE